jgi:hypothetical protein
MPRPWTPVPPSLQDVASLSEWFDRVFEYARGLPSSIESLVAAVEANKIGDHKVNAYRGHPLKVGALVQWMQRAHGADLGPELLPHLSDRTDPYDPSVMLDDGAPPAHP